MSPYLLSQPFKIFKSYEVICKMMILNTVQYKHDIKKMHLYFFLIENATLKCGHQFRQLKLILQPDALAALGHIHSWPKVLYCASNAIISVVR